MWSVTDTMLTQTTNIPQECCSEVETRPVPRSCLRTKTKDWELRRLSCQRRVFLHATPATLSPSTLGINLETLCLFIKHTFLNITVMPRPWPPPPAPLTTSLTPPSTSPPSSTASSPPSQPQPTITTTTNITTTPTLSSPPHHHYHHHHPHHHTIIITTSTPPSSPPHHHHPTVTTTSTPHHHHHPTTTTIPPSSPPYQQHHQRQHYHHQHHHHYFQFWFNWPTFPHITQGMHGPVKRIQRRIFGAWSWIFYRPDCFPLVSTNQQHESTIWHRVINSCRITKDSLYCSLDNSSTKLIHVFSMSSFSNSADANTLVFVLSLLLNY